MDDEGDLMDEMMSNFDNLKDTMDDDTEEDPGSSMDLTQTMEYSVDIREITQHRKSRAYKSNLSRFKGRLKSQLERVQRKRFDSDDSSGNETTLEWLDRLQRNRRQRPAIMQQGNSVNDDEDKVKAIQEDAYQRHVDFQSCSGGYIEHDSDPNIQMERLDTSESESEPCQKLISRRGDEESCKRASQAEKERRMVAETLGSLDPSLHGDERKVRTGEQIKSSKECELKRVVRVKDQGSKTFRIYKKHEIDQTEGSTREEAIEIVEEKHSPLPRDHGRKKTTSTIPNHLAPGSSASQQQHGEMMPASGAMEESEDDDEIPSHIQQLYTGTPDPVLAVRSRDYDDVALLDAETEAKTENENVRGEVPSDVKMFGKMKSGKRRFAKRAHRRANRQATSSSSEHDNDSKDSLEVMMKELKVLKKEHDESSSSTDPASSLLRRQTVRLMKRIYKRSRENSETGGTNGNDHTSNKVTNMPSRKRARRSTSPDIDVEETVKAHIKKFEKGTTYTRRYFQKRHRVKQFCKCRDKKEKTDCVFDSKKNAVANEASVPVNLENTDAGPSNIQSNRNPPLASADDKPLFLLNDTQNPIHSPQLDPDSQPPSPANLPCPSIPAMTPRKGKIIRVDQTPSFFIIPKDQRHPKNSIQTKPRIVFAFLMFIFIIFSLSFLIRFVYFCNPASRCSRCDIEFTLYKFIDSNSGLRHLKVPPI